MSSNPPNKFKLKKPKSESPFQVPDGYFEGFNERLNKRLTEDTVPAPGKTQYLRLFRNQMAIAASFIGLMLLAYTGIKLIVNRQDKSIEIGQNGIANLTDYPVSDLDETMIYDLYNEVALEENNSGSAGSDVTDAMIDYLVMEDADIEGLMTDI